jgi:hypothetical protein
MSNRRVFADEPTSPRLACLITAFTRVIGMAVYQQETTEDAFAVAVTMAPSVLVGDDRARLNNRSEIVRA